MAKKLLNYSITATSVVIERLDYPNGEDGEAVVGRTETFDVSAIPEELKSGEDVVASLAAYGLSQILQDRVSSVTGGGDAKLDKMMEVYELLKAGEWKAQRVSNPSERKVAIAADFAEGFARFIQSQGKEMDAATASAYLQALSNEERKALRAHDKVKPFIQAVRDEASAKAADIDLSDLLG